MPSAMKCRICAADSAPAFSHEILGKYMCTYFFCEHCGFLQTEDPYWLGEAYANAIGSADTGILARNIRTSQILTPLLIWLFGRNNKYLDVAGGYGILTRLMRDRGFNYYWADKYSDNLFAEGFEASPDESYAAISAFEVLEHVTDPIGFLSTALQQGKTRSVVLSTVLFDGRPPQPDSWWYYAFEGGQHISFYQHRTLQTIAKKLGLHCHSNGSMHLFTDRNLNPYFFRLLTNRLLAYLVSPLQPFFMEPKTMSDHRKSMHI